MQLGTQLRPIVATEGATATQQKPTLSEGRESSFDVAMLDETSTEPTGADGPQGEVAVLMPTTSPAMTYSSFAAGPELALGAMKGGAGETMAIDASGEILPQIAESETPGQIAKSGTPGVDASPEQAGVLPTTAAIKEVASGEFQGGADGVRTEATPKAGRTGTLPQIMSEATEDLDQAGERKALSDPEAMRSPAPRLSEGPASLHAAASHAEKIQGWVANPVADQTRNTQVPQPLATNAAANTEVAPEPLLRQEFGTGPVANSDGQTIQGGPSPLSATHGGVDKILGSKNTPIETSVTAVSGLQSTETTEVSHSTATSDTASQYTSTKETAHFTVTGRLPETSEMALMQDGVTSVATELSTSDPSKAELGSDIAMIEMRAAESLTGRAEVSAHLRAELPRHIAQQLADVARTMPDRPVELTLSPEELGRLRLTFTGDLSAMSVSVSVERPETMDLMRRHIEILAQEMREIGYGEVTFSFEQSGSEAGGQSNDAPIYSDHENQHMNPAGISSDAPPSPVRLSVTGTSGVDIRL